MNKGTWLYAEEPDAVLAHHGIKGQKWGVRRFQNEDGTLTKEGQKRYEAIENAKKLARGQSSQGIAYLDAARSIKEKGYDSYVYDTLRKEEGLTKDDFAESYLNEMLDEDYSSFMNAAQALLTVGQTWNRVANSLSNDTTYDDAMKWYEKAKKMFKGSR